MKIYIWFLCLLLTGSFCQAQKFVDVSSVDSPLGQGLYYTINGEPFISARFSKVTEGSPYINTEFIPGILVLSGGRQYQDVPMKINILEGTLLYLNEQKEELESTVPIRKVIIPDTKTGEPRIFLHSDFTCSRPQKTWYELLDSGKAVLLKFDKRIMKENKPYGSATTEQIIHSRIEYLLIYNYECFSFRNRKELEQILKQSAPEFNIAVAKNNSKEKGDEPVSALIRAFNDFHKTKN